MSLKDQIVQSQDLKKEVVHVPEWNHATLSIREMCEGDYFSYVLSVLTDDGKAKRSSLHEIRGALLVRCLYDEETNQRIFADDEVGLLLKKSKPVLNRLFEIAQRINSMTPGEEQELSKLSGTVPISSSTSPSPPS